MGNLNSKLEKPNKFRVLANKLISTWIQLEFILNSTWIQDPNKQHQNRMIRPPQNTTENMHLGLHLLEKLIKLAFLGKLINLLGFLQVFGGPRNSRWIQEFKINQDGVGFQKSQ